METIKQTNLKSLALRTSLRYFPSTVIAVFHNTDVLQDVQVSFPMEDEEFIGSKEDEGSKLFNSTQHRLAKLLYKEFMEKFPDIKGVNLVCKDYENGSLYTGEYHSREEMEIDCWVQEVNEFIPHKLLSEKPSKAIINKHLSEIEKFRNDFFNHTSDKVEGNKEEVIEIITQAEKEIATTTEVNESYDGFDKDKERIKMTK